MSNVFDRVLREIGERRDALTQVIVSGSAKSLDEYRGMCGELRGLSFSYNHIIDLKQRLQEED